MFLEFVLDEADGQPGGVDRHVEFFEQVRQAADVVLVSVGDEQALDAVLVLQHVGEVRDDQIDAEHIGIREDEAAVDEDHIALALIQGNVLADFTQTAQRADVHGDGRVISRCSGSLDGVRGAGPGGAVRQPDRSTGCSAVLIRRGRRGRGAGMLCAAAFCSAVAGPRGAGGGAGLVLRVGRRFPLGLGCARLAGMGRTLAVLGRLCGIFTFWLELFHRKPSIVVFPGWCLPSAGTGSPQKRLRSMYFKSGCSYA